MPESAVPQGVASQRLLARARGGLAEPNAVSLPPQRTLARLSAKMAPEFMRPKEALK